MSDLLSYFISPSKRFYLLYLLSASVIAIFYLWLTNQKITRHSFRNYWLHPSALLDYQFFIVSALIKTYFIMPLIISTQSVMLWTHQTLVNHLGMIYLPGINRDWVILVYTVTLFIVSDFSRYWVHRLMHTIPFLWHFHKVHHSPEALNPVTFYRIHPVENFLFGLRYSLVIGVVTGIFIYLFGAKVQRYDILGANALLVIFNFIGGNLRHSHIEISYPAFLEKWFISPRQHQLHHSYRFTRFNYGGYLAIWDTMFKTVKITAEAAPSPYGLGEAENRRYQSLLSLFFTPFSEVYSKWHKKTID